MSRPHPSSQRGLARIVHRAPDLPASFPGAVLRFAPAKVEEFAEMIEGLGFDDLVEGGWDGGKGCGEGGAPREVWSQCDGSVSDLCCATNSVRRRHPLDESAEEHVAPERQFVGVPNEGSDVRLGLFEIDRRESFAEALFQRIQIELLG